MAADPPESGPEQSPDSAGPQSEEIQHSQVSAIVPERVARGVFSTGAVVVQGVGVFGIVGHGDP